MEVVSGANRCVSSHLWRFTAEVQAGFEKQLVHYAHHITGMQSMRQEAF